MWFFEFGVLENIAGACDSWMVLSSWAFKADVIISFQIRHIFRIQNNVF